MTAKVSTPVDFTGGTSGIETAINSVIPRGTKDRVGHIVIGNTVRFYRYSVE